jgi:hypothetical protein
MICYCLVELKDSDVASGQVGDYFQLSAKGLDQSVECAYLHVVLIFKLR